jgi:glyoxylase-like metal-dependent hydrolase (beta-lactamase superfamily II)
MPGKWTTKKGSKITLTVSGRNNVYLIESKNTIMLVDAGMAYMYKNLLSKITGLNVRPGIIALTHAHYDHAENTEKLKKHFKAKVLIHRAEAACLASGINPEDDPFSGASLPDGENYSPVKADIMADDGFKLDGIEIMHTPGHSPGSICVLVDNEIAAVGDSMFSVHPGQVMTPYVMDRMELLKSWEKLFKTGCRLFLPAHGRPIKRAAAVSEYKKYSKKH